MLLLIGGGTTITNNVNDKDIKLNDNSNTNTPTNIIKEDIKPEVTDDSKDLTPNLPDHIQDILAEHGIKPRQRAHVRRYPQELKEVALGLRASGYSYDNIAKVLRVGVGTVHSWCNEIGGKSNRGASRVSEAVKRQMRNKFLVTANTIMSSITDEDIAKASLRDKAISSGVMVDKYRVMEDTRDDDIFTINEDCYDVATNNDQLRTKIAQKESELIEIEASNK